ncbi:MAG TPA: ribonuclease P protein component [Acidimicrobiales bacterium]|nr:ribonuclease P protein component [Acidimicrobiales bacterium]
MPAPVRRRDDFAALSRSRARGRSGPLRVTRARPSPDRRVEQPHVAYAVPRAVGTAVVRNRIRRRLRAMIADLGPDEGLTPGLYLVGVGAGAIELSPADLRRHLLAALAAAEDRPRRGRS